MLDSRHRVPVRGAINLEFVVIRSIHSGDAAAIARIYNHYVVNTTVSFEEQPVSVEEMRDRITEVTSADLPWLVIEQDGQLAGYAYASKWKGRCAYRFSVEVSVYLDPAVARRGLGSRLYQALFAALRERGVHVAIGGIAQPNPASVALHEKFGMQKVAHFKEVGFKFNQWLDVGYWQIVLPDQTGPAN